MEIIYTVEKRKDQELNIDLVYLVLQKNGETEEICFSNVWTGELKILKGLTQVMEKMGISNSYSTTRAKEEYPVLQKIEEEIKKIHGEV